MTAPFSQIVGTGSALPGDPVSNDVLVGRLAMLGVETSDSWIRERTGITQRYMAPPGISSSHLGAQAARAAMADAGVTAQEIDLVIVATSTPDIIFPSTACLVQKHLGIQQGAAFDVQAVCSGFVYAMTTADLFIRAGKAKTALVIGAEVFSRLLDWTDRSTCVLFGDGAGAVVLRAGDEPGILATKIEARGEFEGILRTAGSLHTAASLPGGLPLTGLAGAETGEAEGNPYLTMDGQAVFKMAVEVLESSAREVIQAAGLTPEQVDWMVPHQANIRILHYTAKRLGLPLERLVVTVDRHANTSAASVPLALDHARRAGSIRAGQTVLMQGVGGGFTWGAVLARMSR